MYLKVPSVQTCSSPLHSIQSPVLTQGVTRKKFSQRVQNKLEQYGNFQSPGIIESILECGLLLTRLISPTPALNSHQGQPRNKIRVKIDFEKQQERLEHVEIAKLR
jgi:hypothetical protein